MALHHHFTETQLPQQRNYNSTPFPSVLSPTPNSPTCSVSHLIQTITTQKQFLDSLLHKTGAILFRGFDVNTAKDFNDVVEAFGYEEYSPLGVTALRSQVFGRVYTANESSTEQKINFHHEMPMVCFFSLIGYKRIDFAC